MQAIQRFIQFTLILVVTLATTGMRLKLDDCHGVQPISIGFADTNNCCCEKPNTPKPACNDITCVTQAPVPVVFNAKHLAQQQTQALKANPAVFAFTQFIRPALLAKIPHFTLPPPASGRFIGILHQTFII